jgi:hypothetical protein
VRQVPFVTAGYTATLGSFQLTVAEGSFTFEVSGFLHRTISIEAVVPGSWAVLQSPKGNFAIIDREWTPVVKVDGVWKVL